MLRRSIFFSHYHARNDPLAFHNAAEQFGHRVVQIQKTFAPKSLGMRVLENQKVRHVVHMHQLVALLQAPNGQKENEQVGTRRTGPLHQRAGTAAFERHMIYLDSVDLFMPGHFVALSETDDIHFHARPGQAYASRRGRGSVA